MRASSTTCTVTCQPSSSLRSNPSTDSIGRPKSSGSSRRTRATASGPDGRRRPLLLLAIVHLPVRSCPGPAHGQPLEQLLLAIAPLELVDPPVVELQLERQQLALDVLLVVE